MEVSLLQTRLEFPGEGQALNDNMDCLFCGCLRWGCVLVFCWASWEQTWKGVGRGGLGHRRQALGGSPSSSGVGGLKSCCESRQRAIIMGETGSHSCEPGTATLQDVRLEAQP